MPALPGTLGLVWREGESGDLHWKPWEELEVTCCTCVVQQSDKPMLLYQDFDFLGGEGTFWFFWRRGSVSSSLIPK